MEQGVIIQIGINLIALAFAAGLLYGRIKALEKKVDKHNNLLDRMTKVEVKVEGIEKQLDGGAVA